MLSAAILLIPVTTLPVNARNLRHGNGTRTSYSYDAAGQTTQIFHRKSTGFHCCSWTIAMTTRESQVLIEDAGRLASPGPTIHRTS